MDYFLFNQCVQTSAKTKNEDSQHVKTLQDEFTDIWCQDAETVSSDLKNLQFQTDASVWM